MSFALVLVLVFRGRVYFLLVGACGVVQIVSRCFILYFSFLAFTTFVLPCWVIHVRGSIFFMFLVSNCLLTYIYEFFIDICLYCVLFEIKILFYFIYLYFFHTCGYAFCLSVSGNIQVDSIKLLSTLATDGQQLGLNLSFMNIIL